MKKDPVSGKTVILGVTGGIAAYKAAEICSALIQRGADVHVVMTEHATRFIGPITFRGLTGNQVITGLWDEPREYEIAHVSLPDKADVVIVAPATANFLGKMASGIADDMLSTMLLATTAPVILAPAMNRKMWEHSVVRSNVERLLSLGHIIVGPEEGWLACGEKGAGRLAKPAVILEAVTQCLARSGDLQGTSILVTAGPTEEPIDPIRFITNRSSGKMGWAISIAAARRGAQVTLVSGPTSLCPQANVNLIPVRTAAEMLDAVLAHLDNVQVVIGAAAVADYAPKSPADRKLKKTKGIITLELVPTEDILALIGAHKQDKLLVGFAAETDNLLENARAKLLSKNLDLIVANDVSKLDIGFGSDFNEVSILRPDGSVECIPRAPKSVIADRILDIVRDTLSARKK